MLLEIKFKLYTAAKNVNHLNSSLFKKKNYLNFFLHFILLNNIVLILIILIETIIIFKVLSILKINILSYCILNYFCWYHYNYQTQIQCCCQFLETLSVYPFFTDINNWYKPFFIYIRNFHACTLFNSIFTSYSHFNPF